MSRTEFIDWVAFYRAYPFDDLHRYHRPAALIAQKLVGGRVQDYLDFLSPPPVPEGLTDVDASFLKAFGISSFGE